MNPNLTQTTKDQIHKLQAELESLLSLESNIEVAWKLEKMQHSNRLDIAATEIRKTIQG